MKGWLWAPNLHKKTNASTENWDPATNPSWNFGPLKLWTTLPILPDRLRGTKFHEGLVVGSQFTQKDEWSPAKSGPHDQPFMEFRTPRIGDNTAPILRLIANATAAKCVRNRHSGRKKHQNRPTTDLCKNTLFLKNNRFAQLFRFRDQHSTVCNFCLRFGTTLARKSSILLVSEQTLP